MIGVQRTDNGCAAVFIGTDRTRVGFWFRLREMGWACVNVHDGYWALRLWRLAFTRRPANARPHGEAVADTVQADVGTRKENENANAD